MRLDKFLCETGNVSRKEARDYIKKGLVSVNGTKITDFGFNLNESSDKVLFRDKPLTYEKYVYYMLNKPDGVVSATKDPHDTTVIDLFKAVERKNLFPVGRLDKDTTGLLVITDDGELAHHLTSPRHHVPKTYFVEIAHSLSDEDIKRLENGIELTGDGCITFSNKAKELSLVDVQRLFDRFFTLNTARQSAGLGLSIAKVLTEKMNGKIEAVYKDERLFMSVIFKQNE